MFNVIQIIFPEKFVSPDFTIRTAPGLSGPTNTCVLYLIRTSHKYKKKNNNTKKSYLGNQ